jgi:hypothetical protein
MPEEGAFVWVGDVVDGDDLDVLRITFNMAFRDCRPMRPIR